MQLIVETVHASLTYAGTSGFQTTASQRPAASTARKIETKLPMIVPQKVVKTFLTSVPMVVMAAIGSARVWYSNTAEGQGKRVLQWWAGCGGIALHRTASLLHLRRRAISA